MEAEVEERVSETGVTNSETDKEDFLIARSSIRSRPRDWSVFNETKFVRRLRVPEFAPRVGDEGAVV